MSLTTSLNNALSGLRTNISAIQVASGNISNVNTEGYSRKVHQQENRVLAGQSAGVDTAGIVRQLDQFLKFDLIREHSVVGEAGVTNEFFERVQSFFGSPGNDNAIGNFITNLATALEDVSNNPDVPAHRITAVGEAAALAQELQNLGTEIQTLRVDADQRISTSVEAINLSLESIAELNGQISANLGLGLPVGDLQDQREAALANLSQKMDLQFFVQSDGQMSVLTIDGKRLVSGGSAATMSYTPAATLTPLQTYPGTINGIMLEGVDITGSITSGELASLVEMRDTNLPALTTQLDQLAAALRDGLNRIHNRGANTPFGSGQAAGDPAAMLGSREITNTGDTLTLGESVTFQILDVNGQPATASFTLAAGATTPAAIATAIDGYLDGGIDFGEAAFTNDRLEIKLESGYRLAILDNGTTANQGDVSITFDADGDTVDESYLGFSNFFGLNDLFETPQLVNSGLALENQGSSVGISSTIRIRQDVFDNPDLLSRGILRGGPPNYHLGPGDQEIAQDLATAFNSTFTFAAVVNGPPQTTETLAGYAGTILSFNAAQADGAADRLRFREFFFENLETRVASDSGVNLDEELANIVIYQNAYSASARVIQTTNELFDTLINL